MTDIWKHVTVVTPNSEKSLALVTPRDPVIVAELFHQLAGPLLHATIFVPTSDYVLSSADCRLERFSQALGECIEGEFKPDASLGWQMACLFIYAKEGLTLPYPSLDHGLYTWLKYVHGQQHWVIFTGITEVEDRLSRVAFRRFRKEVYRKASLRINRNDPSLRM